MLTLLLAPISFVLTSIISLFPESSGFPTEFHTAFSTLGGYMHLLDSFIPFDDLLVALTLIFSVEIAIFVFKTFKWLISHVPLIGGRG